MELELTNEWVKGKMARAIPGAWFDHDTKYWKVESDTMDPRTATVILKLFPDLDQKYPVLAERRTELTKGVRPFDNATPLNERIMAPKVQRRLAQEGHDFYDFQAIDLGYVNAVLNEHGSAYIGWERGLGKTLGSCALIEAQKAKRVLIVAPNTAKGPVWKPELERFLPKFDIIVLPNPKKQRERMLRVVQELTHPFILVVHYEALAIIGEDKRGTGWAKYGEWDMVIADEAHRIKNPNAKMTRALKKVPTKKKVALSGSIIENHAEELFSPLNWLYPKHYKAKWRDWNDRFLDYVEGNFGKEFVGIKMDKLDELRRELGVFMVYRRKEDELDLPKRTDQTLYVELTPGQRKVYNELAMSCVAQIDEKTTLKASDGLPMLTALRQIASGLDLVGEEIRDSSKIDLALEMIEDNPDEPTVVFVWYKAMAYAIQQRLGEDRCFVVTGDVKHENRTDMIERFQKGERSVFIGTLATLGESVNLQRASQAILLDRHWNPGTNVQAEDRIYRMGQKNPVTITHVIAKDTVDEHRVLPTITNKEALRGMILGGAK